MTPVPLVRIAARGGVVSPAELLRALASSEEAGNDFIAFGSRQDIVFPAGALPPPQPPGGAPGPNIVSSSVAVGLTETTWWLGEGEYERVLEGLSPAPRLALNLVDPVQRLVPHFTGDLNLLATPDEHRWHLWIRSPGEPEGSGSRLFRGRVPIHSEELASTVRRIEEGWLPAESNEPDPRGTSERTTGMKAAGLPVLEGFEAMPGGNLRLGVLRRDHRFRSAFLRDVSRLCQETRIGKIGITPWKTLLVKGIRASERDRWEALTLRHRINLRHGAFDLPWHIPCLDEEALDLRAEVVRALDHEDLPPGTATFGIREHPAVRPFTTVVIEVVPGATPGERRYRVLRTGRPEPSAGGHEQVAADLSRADLPGLLAGLLAPDATGGRPKGLEEKLQPAGTSAPPRPSAVPTSAASSIPDPLPGRFRCGDCLTEYDPSEGDPEAGISPGTSFDALPDTFTCHLCSAGTARFAPVAAPGGLR